MRPIGTFLATGLTTGPAIGLSAALLAGCITQPSYRAPAADEAETATVVVGQVDEDNNVNSGAWLNVVEVDGESTGRVTAVRVTPGEHTFQVRHFDSWALISGNTKYREISFVTEPGRTYEIRGYYCCGYFTGVFELYAIDQGTQQQVAVAR